MSNEDFMRDDVYLYEVEMPVREFFYTLDQIAYMLDTTQQYLEESVLHYVGRSWHKKPRHMLRCVNIAKVDASPDWRVAETDFISWMKIKGITFRQQFQVGIPVSRNRKG